jgi:TonB family protein
LYSLFWSTCRYFWLLPIEVTRVVVSEPVSENKTEISPKKEEVAPIAPKIMPNIVKKEKKKAKEEKPKDIPPPQEPSPQQPQTQSLGVPSVEAQPIEQIKPEIPYELRSQDYKSFVRVSVVVDIDGSSNPTLKTSSGNDKVDLQVLSALKKWRWRPALLDGRAVKSVRYFRFEFEVK